jgi:hypothetical protein
VVPRGAISGPSSTPYVGTLKTVIEQFGDLPGARQVAKIEAVVSLVQQTQLRELMYQSR